MTVQDVHIDSQALDRRMCVRMVLPPDYNMARSAPYPVLYFLHPWGLDPRYITKKLNIHAHLAHGVKAGTLPPLVIALPTGYRSFYVNAADPPGHDWSPVVASNEQFFQNALEQYGQYGDYLQREVIPYIEARCHVRTDRAGRAIGGISMGGAAAAVHGFRDPGAFCAVGIHSPALFGGPPDNNGPPWIFGLDRASFARRNPADVARSLSPKNQPRIYLDCGDEDSMLEQVRYLHRALAAGGITHEYAIVPGGHDKTYWEPRMPEYLAFYARSWS
jgi:enterochelin esterase-like enzyme